MSPLICTLQWDILYRYLLVLAISRQIVTAIQYCHKLHVVHRDLKPENVVFFEKLGMVKLTDFGFSNKFNPGQRLLTSVLLWEPGILSARDITGGCL